MLVKYWLNFTKEENGNQYLTDLTDNSSFKNVSVKYRLNLTEVGN